MGLWQLVHDSRKRAGCVVLALVVVSRPARADTLNASAMALRSSGSASGANWTLGGNGYIGTYIQLSQPSQVNFTLNASGLASSGLNPQMTLAIANQTQSFDVSSGSLTNYSYTSPTLPAGTYFVRVQLDNQDGVHTPSLTVNNLQVTGATLLNSNTATNAMTAAQTYIDHFRQGSMNLSLVDPHTGLPLQAGTNVQVRLVRNAFNLGSATYDSNEANNFYNTYPWMTATASSTGNTALAYKYQQFLLNNFNMTEPENAGKWASNEATQNVVTMSYVDQLLNFSKAHTLQVRMHNLIWNSQQPSWVNSLFTANNVSGLNAAVTNRVTYYVKGKDAQGGPLLNQARALGYSEIDVLNEGSHAGTTDNYMTTLGASGVANVYKQVADAATAVGANVKLYTNEYNVLQNSSDAYANWYRNHIEAINNAGIAAGQGKVVSGVGSEFYVTTQAVSATAMQQVMQNLAVTGLPFSETEFAINSATPAATAGADLQTAFTMIYGNPMATTFSFWDFWQALDQNDSFLTNYQAGALMDASGNPTALYTNYFLPLMAQDHFVLPGQIAPTTLSVDANGQVNFTGSFGTYALTINGQDYLFTSSPTSTSFTLAVPEPGSMLLMGAGALALLAHRARRLHRFDARQR